MTHKASLESSIQSLDLEPPYPELGRFLLKFNQTQRLSHNRYRHKFNTPNTLLRNLAATIFDATDSIISTLYRLDSLPSLIPKISVSTILDPTSLPSQYTIWELRRTSLTREIHHRTLLKAHPDSEREVRPTGKDQGGA